MNYLFMKSSQISNLFEKFSDLFLQIFKFKETTEVLILLL